MNVRRFMKKTDPRLAAVMQEALAAGWAFRITNGGHVQGLDPDGRVRWTTSSSPSDWRSSLNARSQLRRALRGEG